MPVNQDSYESELILWNNQDITIEGKSLFWRRWAKNGIYYIQDIVNENGKFLTFEEFNQKYNMSVNFFNFFQILTSIPPNLKSKEVSTLRPKNSVLDNSDIFNFSTEKLVLSKMKCKDYYCLFQEKSEATPTVIKSWVKHYSGIEDKWKKLFQNIPHLSADNKLRQFSFKLLHCILVTKKELKRFKISDSKDFFFSCKSPDSLEHAFLECPAGLNIFQEVLQQQQ